MDDLKILIAEDDRNLAELWEEGMVRGGHTVHIVGDGQAALDWLQANPLPDVLVVDYNMPLVNGDGVLRGLRVLDPENTVTTIVVTANPQVQSEPIIAAADMFLQKPVSWGDIKTLAERLASRGR